MSRQRTTSSHQRIHGARLLVKGADSVVNLAALLLFLLLLAYGAYAIWDSTYVQNQASSQIYETYKPVGEKESDHSFKELQEINPDVIGWISVDGTAIDYPLTQGQDNEKYVNADAKGEYSLSGNPFLDYRNSADFTDVLHIIYGHHMQGQLMFGELDAFMEEAYFNTHSSGALYCGDGEEYELEFFAILQADAYDGQIYDPLLQWADQQGLLARLERDAQQYREIGVTDADRLVFLSTCGVHGTNIRTILAARLKEASGEVTSEAEGSRKISEEKSGQAFASGMWKIKWRIPVLIASAIGAGIFFVKKRKRK